jgi:PAS domain S-box-containing protein
MQFRDHQNSRRFLILFVSTGVFIIVTGAIAAAGWFLKIGAFTSVFPEYTPMKFNTALCFVISGTCFLLLIKHNTSFLNTLFKLLTILFGAYAIVSFSQDVFHWSAGIDQLFVADYNSNAQKLPFPGRMSPSTSLCFGLLAISFLGIDSKERAYRNIAQYLLHTITLIAFISFVGYLFKVPFTFKFSFFSTMALNTACAFLLLSIVGSLINYDLGFTDLFTGKGIGNIVARKLFPGMIISLIVLGYISIELQRKNYITAEFGIILSTISFSIIGLFLIRNTLKEMNRLDLKRTEAENETRLLNKNLEDIIKQRTIDLEHSNDRFIKIFNSNPTCIAITRLDNGEYTDVNPALLKMLKYSRGEIIGHTASELSIISAEYRQFMVDSLNKNGLMRDADVVLKDKNNHDRHCILSAEMLENDGHKYLMSFVYDITDIKIVENNLKDTKKKLEILTDKLTNQNKQLLNFAHITSHNLRSPVSNLSLLVQFYKESTSEKEKDELWGSFETVVGHLTGTLDELLETLNIQEDTAKESQNLSFEKTFNAIKEILIGQIIDTKAVITTDFSKATHIFYPKVYLESIMLNLISNAIKYRSPGRPPEIVIASDNINGQITLSVQDNGLGIDMDKHGENLFGLRKTFHRNADAKGLGLFITKTQIEAMDGEISAQSTVGDGTSFNIIFNKMVG